MKWNYTVYNIETRCRMGQPVVAIFQRSGSIRSSSQQPVVFLTAHTDSQTLNRALATDSYGYIIKPFSSQALVATVATALQRSRVENQVSEIARRHQRTLSSMGDAVIAADRSSRVSFINAVAEKLTEWDAADAIGQPLTSVFNVCAENHHEGTIELLGKVFANNKVVQNEDDMSLFRRDGCTVPIELNFAPHLR